MKSIHAQRRELAVAALILAVGVARVCLILWSSLKANAGPGFPLDDPWIHLQFARNLHEFGAFSYFRNEMITAGSTSPLYTILLSLGFFFTSNEMLLSYVLGITFFAASGVFFMLILRRLVPDRPVVALAGLLLFLLEPRMEWAALSGMETTLFIAAVLASMYFFAARKWRILPVSLGILLWIRPEAVVLTAILGAGAVYRAYFRRPPHSEGPSLAAPRALWLESRLSVGLLLVIATAYFVMNYALSGSPFPNTYAAKIKFYASGTPDFPANVYAFLTGGHMIVIALFGAIGALLAVRDFLQARRVEPFLLLCWIVLLFLAYWRNLPYLFQEGRYMMPVIPPFLILGLLGASSTGEFLQRRLFAKADLRRYSLVFSALVLVPIAQFFLGGEAMRVRYAETCRYISDRQVKTAHWLHDNLPEDAVVATHDIGAIGFYSGRRVMDMVGLVSPEMIPNLHNLDSLKAFLIRKRVTHLAVLRNWFEIVNVNPLFQTDEAHPEIMEVFAFDPFRIHVVPGNVGGIEQLAFSYMARGESRTAISLLTSAIRLDPLSSRLYMNLGLALLSAGKTVEGESSLRRSLEIQPTLLKARAALAQVEAARGKGK
jgi:tetratricopeptide (TPR) repeat protein